jgi:hypothetical protein
MHKQVADKFGNSAMELFGNLHSAVCDHFRQGNNLPYIPEAVLKYLAAELAGDIYMLCEGNGFDNFCYMVVSCEFTSPEQFWGWWWPCMAEKLGTKPPSSEVVQLHPWAKCEVFVK